MEAVAGEANAEGAAGVERERSPCDAKTLMSEGEVAAALMTTTCRGDGGEGGVAMTMEWRRPTCAGGGGGRC